MIVIAAAGAGVVAATEVMAQAPRGSTAIRTESTMARVTGAPATAIVPRRTAITNTPTVATAQAMATKITTNKPTVRRMRTDTSRATTAEAAGAGTNSNRQMKKPCGGPHGFYFLRQEARRTAPAYFYQTVQRSASGRTIGEPSLQLNACLNSGRLESGPITRYLPMG